MTYLVILVRVLTRSFCSTHSHSRKSVYWQACDVTPSSSGCFSFCLRLPCFCLFLAFQQPQQPRVMSRPQQQQQQRNTNTSHHHPAPPPNCSRPPLPPYHVVVQKNPGITRTCLSFTNIGSLCTFTSPQLTMHSGLLSMYFVLYVLWHGVHKTGIWLPYVLGRKTVIFKGNCFNTLTINYFIPSVVFHCAIFSAYGQYLQQHYQTQRSTSSTNTRTDVMPRPPLPDYVTATHMASRRKQQAPLPPVSHARAHSFDNYSTPAPASVTSSHSSSQFFSVDVNERLVDGE